MSAILSRELEVFELGSRIQSQVQSEMEKGQREYFLRQQLKAIQTELGEADPEQAELPSSGSGWTRSASCRRRPARRPTASSSASSGSRRLPPNTA